jgi:undecaprenyl-diphosphatase
MAVWDDPDVDLLREINGLAESAPAWADRTVEYVGEYGTVFVLAVLGVCAWWRVSRRRETREAAVTGLAGLMWAPLAAAVALLLNIPIRGFVERPRPSVEHRGLEVLAAGDGGYSFVSGHATLVMALAVGIFMVHRRYGLVGIGLAVVAGISRLYMGVHYPTDVVGGLALGTAVALLLAPAAMWLLTPLVRTVANSPRMGALVWAGPQGAASDEPAVEEAADDSADSGLHPQPHQRDERDERDLAA